MLSVSALTWDGVPQRFNTQTQVISYSRITPFQLGYPSESLGDLVTVEGWAHLQSFGGLGEAENLRF